MVTSFINNNASFKLLFAMIEQFSSSGIPTVTAKLISGSCKNISVESNNGNKLIEHLEEDDDVTNVYTTMAESEEEDEE